MSDIPDAVLVSAYYRSRISRREQRRQQLRAGRVVRPLIELAVLERARVAALAAEEQLYQERCSHGVCSLPWHPRVPHDNHKE